MRRLARSERGQAMVLTVVCVTVLLGMAALVLDVGSWFVDRRQLQAGVDAAALAAAQDLPWTDSANSAAASYASKNGVSSPTISFSGQNSANDTVNVSASRVSQGFFSKVFNITSVTLHANASARIDVLDGVLRALPFGIAADDPDLVCGLPCFNQPTTVPVGKVGVPGNFDLISLNGAKTPGDLASLISTGYDGLMKLGDYDGTPGAKFDSSQIQGAMQGRVGDTVVLPVYDSVTSNGTNSTYHVIGWVSFTITGFDLSGDSGSLYGSFHRLVQSGGSRGGESIQPPYSAVSVSLTH
jgi:Putative Flp pilus-assembly TadE/G-like